MKEADPHGAASDLLRSPDFAPGPTHGLRTGVRGAHTQRSLSFRACRAAHAWGADRGAVATCGAPTEAVAARAAGADRRCFVWFPCGASGPGRAAGQAGRQPCVGHCRTLAPRAARAPYDPGCSSSARVTL